jgi:excisionase family DNA binding protein
MDFEPLLDSKAAGALLNIHEKTLIRLARKGAIPSMRIGKLWRFRASQLLTLIRSVPLWAR